MVDLTYLVGLVELGGSLEARFGPMLAKKELNLLAIVDGSVVIRPLILIKLIIISIIAK